MRAVLQRCGYLWNYDILFLHFYPFLSRSMFYPPHFQNNYLLYCDTQWFGYTVRLVWYQHTFGSLRWGSGFLIRAINASWPLGKALPCLLSSLTVCGSFQVTFKPDASTAEVHDEHIRGLLKVRANLPPSAQIQAVFRNVLGFMRMCLSMLKAKILRHATKSKPFRTYFNLIIFISNIK